MGTGRQKNGNGMCGMCFLAPKPEHIPQAASALWVGLFGCYKGWEKKGEIVLCAVPATRSALVSSQLCTSQHTQRKNILQLSTLFSVILPTSARELSSLLTLIKKLTQKTVSSNDSFLCICSHQMWNMFWSVFSLWKCFHLWCPAGWQLINFMFVGGISFFFLKMFTETSKTEKGFFQESVPKYSRLHFQKCLEVFPAFSYTWHLKNYFSRIITNCDVEVFFPFDICH